MATMAVLPFLAMACFLSCRAVLAFRLARAGVQVRFVWLGVPGYLEEQFRRAPEETRRLLSKLSLWNQRFFWLLLASLAIAFFVAVPFLLSHPR